MERVFLQIDPEQIKKEMEKVQELAWDNDLRLPDDDPCDVIVYPDGSFKVLILDLSQLYYVSDHKSTRTRQVELERMSGRVDTLRERLMTINIENTDT